MFYTNPALQNEDSKVKFQFSSAAYKGTHGVIVFVFSCTALRIATLIKYGGGVYVSC